MLSFLCLLLATSLTPGDHVKPRPEADLTTQSLTITDLRTENRSKPLGIDEATPRLSWRLESQERGIMQSAYQIQVATDRGDLQEGRRLIWDTGRVESDQSHLVAYAGPPLESRTRYYWRVRVWNEGGESSAWSDPAWWEMGLLDPSEWEARWIEPDWEADPSKPQPSPMLRRTFEVDGSVRSARLYATAHGVYEIHLNGRRVGDALFAPGWTSYHNRLQYQTYDLTELLAEGENAVGAILGDGWYRGYIGFDGSRNAYGEDVALLAQIEITYQDGRTAVAVATDEGWKATTGPIRMSDIYMGETYDARLEKDGWTTAAYDDGGWEGVRVVGHDMTNLIAQEGPDVRRIQTLRPKDIFTTPAGDLVVDIGQNLVGWIRIRAEGEPGTDITLRHAEVLDKHGNFYTDNLRAADQTTRYILKGGGEEVFEPHFTFQGFRYVAVDGYPGELSLDDLEAVVVHSDVEPTGHFESSNPLVNQLQHNIVWGQKGNFVDVPTDCPQRDERLGWTGDAQVFAPTAAYNMHVAGFFAKWLGDVAADQEADGRIPHVVPDVLNWGGATGWADAGVIVPWVMYRRYGDARILEDQYPSMKAWVEYMRGRAAQDDSPYIWNGDTHFGDWLAYNSDSPAYPGATTSTDLIATAYFAYSAGLTADAAAMLGNEQDAATYRQLRDHVVEAFRAEFVTPRGRLTSDTQTAYVLALDFDLLPDDLRDGVARRLASEVNDRGHLTTGFLGTPQLTHVLSEHGYLDEAYRLLLRTEYPSWLYPVTMGATTIWERWDGIKPDSTFQDVGMNSFNHYAYGAVGDWLYRVVAGLRPAAPGYKAVEIAPRPGGGFTHARARHASPYGVVESGWRRDGDSFHLTIEVPPNSAATVRLPQAAGADVTEGGLALGDVEGVERSMLDGTDILVEVGSGRYSFVYASPALKPDATGEADAGSTDAGAPEVELRDDDASSAFGIHTKLADLIAHAEARDLLFGEVPALMHSFWLSQAMGFPLERAASAIPVDISAEQLAAVDRSLRAIAR